MRFLWDDIGIEADGLWEPQRPKLGGMCRKEKSGDGDSPTSHPKLGTGSYPVGVAVISLLLAV